MKSVSASEAKQNFGELLAQAAKAPVRIVRHGKTVAAVVPAAWLEQHAAKVDPRLAARAAQQEKVREREDKHRRIALALLTAPAPQRKAMIQQAQQMVDRWQAEQLCSPDYIEGWRAWLRLPTAELAKVMTCTDDAWAKPMRQNSPFLLNT
ncbi:MAG TPA: type II toxin-antitoxin system Phd/YefM family antitoxin [Burkholderiaceae bacterium]|nr:type II toxin-antitoxin system Phd/YefM family antitoxin [Burkholderiaceae bacterium]